MNPVEILESALKSASPEMAEEIELTLEAGTLEEQESLAARILAAQQAVPESQPVEKKPTRKTLCALARRAKGKVSVPVETQKEIQQEIQVKRILLCKHCVGMVYKDGRPRCAMRATEIRPTDRACDRVRARKEVRPPKKESKA